MLETSLSFTLPALLMPPFVVYMLFCADCQQGPFGADKCNSSAFSSSNTDHDFNIPGNTAISELLNWKEFELYKNI